MMYRVRRPSAGVLAALALEQSNQVLSYPDIGISLTSTDPAGYHRLHVTRALGTDEALFSAARGAIEAWAGHRKAGAILEPPQPVLEEGATVALALRVWPLWVTAACSIVTVIDEPDRFGFAYGTLPHHPARGEEVFLVVRDRASGRIHLEVSASSQPRSVLARAGGPVSRWIQWRTAEQYLDGFEAMARREKL